MTQISTWKGIFTLYIVILTSQHGHHDDYLISLTSAICLQIILEAFQTNSIYSVQKNILLTHT